MAGIGSAAVALMASCVCNRKKSLGPLHLVHVPRYILYIYILELFNKIAKQGIETWWSCWEWHMWCVSLLKESSFTKSTCKSFEWEPGQAFKPRHLIWKVKKTRVVDSIRFVRFPFASENLTKALPWVLLLLYNPPLAEPRHHWRKLCKPRRMDLVRFQTKLQMCLWTIEDAATSFRI